MNTNAIHAALMVYENYPSKIRPYLLRADTHPLIRSVLTKSGITVLIDILSRAPIANPDRPVMLRVDKMADKLERSEKTVQRAINLLRSKGWLLPSSTHDGRNYRGRYSHREFIIANDLRELLGMPLRQVDQTEQDTSTQMSDGADMNYSQEEAYDKESYISATNNPEMSDGHIGVNKVFKKEAKKEASEKKPEGQKQVSRLPADLLPLQAALGISTGGVCKLMTIAAENKQRLQDIWAARQQVILKSGVKLGRAFLYLKALILSGEDFTGMSKQAQRVNSGPTDNGHKAYWHKRYTGANGVRVRVFEDMAEITQDGNYLQTLPARDMQTIYDAIRAGKLVEIIE